MPNFRVRRLPLDPSSSCLGSALSSMSCRAAGHGTSYALFSVFGLVCFLACRHRDRTKSKAGSLVKCGGTKDEYVFGLKGHPGHRQMLPPPEVPTQSELNSVASCRQPLKRQRLT